MRGTRSVLILTAAWLAAGASPAAAVPTAPGGLRATVSGYSVTLAWTASTNGAYYEVERYNPTYGYYSLIASWVSGASYTDIGLSNGVTYQYRVRAKDANGLYSSYSSAVSALVSVVVPPPGSVTARASGYSVVLSWTGSASGAYYEVERYNPAYGYYGLIASWVSGTSYTDSDLSNGVTYQYRVRAKDSNGTYSAYSPAASVTVGVTVAAPANFTARASGYSVVLSWASSAGGAYYEIERYSTTYGYYSAIASWATGTSYTDSGLSNGVTYQYRMRAKDSVGTYSSYSPMASATVGVAVPAPTGLQARWDGTSGSYVRLSWSGTAASYRVERAGNGSSSYNQVSTAYGSAWTDSVAAFGNYCYRVRGEDSSGTLSAYAGPVCAADPAGVPVSNDLPQSAHPYADYYSNTWTYAGPSGAVSLTLVFDSRTKTEAGYDTIRIFDENGSEAPGSPFSGTQLAGRSVAVSGRVFTIRLETDGSLTDFGFALTAVTPQFPPPPPAPARFKPSGDDTVSGNLVFSWEPVPEAVSYQVDWSSDGVRWSSAAVDTTALQLPLDNGRWLWRVAAKNSREFGSPSQTMAIQVVPGWSAAVSQTRPDSDKVRYRLNIEAVRGPAPTPLGVSGLPSGTSWSFDPPMLSGSGEVTLEVSGLRAVRTQGEYAFSVLAGDAPLQGAERMTFSVSGTLKAVAVHAFPNPSYDGTARIRATFGKTPTTLKLRIFDVTGALVREVSESAPFSFFQEPVSGDFEFLWDGKNTSGRTVASGVYLYSIFASDGSANDASRGTLTVIRR